MGAVDPFRIYKIAPQHFPRLKRSFQELVQGSHSSHRQELEYIGNLGYFRQKSVRAESWWGRSLVLQWLVLTQRCIRSPEWRWSDSRVDWLIQPIKRLRGVWPPTTLMACRTLQWLLIELGRERYVRRRCVILERGWPDYQLLLLQPLTHFQTMVGSTEFSRRQFNYTIAPQNRWFWAWHFLATQFYIITAVKYSQADLTVI